MGRAPTQEASLRYPPSPQGAFKSPRNHNREYGEGHEPRAAHPYQQPHTGSPCPHSPPVHGRPGHPRGRQGAFPLPDKPHTPPQAEQTGRQQSTVQCRSGKEGIAKIKLNYPCSGCLSEPPRRSRTPPAHPSPWPPQTPQAGRAASRLSHSTNHPGARLKIPAPFSMTSSGALLSNCMCVSALGDNFEGPAKRSNEWVKESHQGSIRKSHGLNHGWG